MQKCTVSVVIPVYNVEKYLRECVDSVLAQTYKELEMILVDDGSTDSSGAICDEYAKKDSRITVIHKKNGGLSDARNAGHREAKGKYLYFLDSDDYITANAIEELVGFAEKNETDIVFFDAETLYEDIDDHYMVDYQRSRTYPPAEGAVMLERLIKNNDYHASVPLLFFRNDHVKKNRLSCYTGIIHEDELFTPLAFVKAARVGHLRKKLYVRRMRAGSIMTTIETPKGFYGLYTVTRELTKAMKQYPSGSNEYSALRLSTAETANQAVSRYALLSLHDKKLVRDKLRRLCRSIRKNGFYGSRKLRIKLSSMWLYCLYMAVKSRVLKIKKQVQK